MTDYLEEFTHYLQVLEGLSQITVDVYCKKVVEFLTWIKEKKGGPRSVQDFTRQDIEQYLEYCFYKGNSNQTRHTKLTALSKFFRFLKYEKEISEDITAEIPKPKIFSRRMQTYTKEEILSFFRAIDINTEKGIRDVCIFILAAFCGLRISEIYKLRVGDIIDEGNNLDVAIPEDIGKKHSSRTIYLWKVPAAFIRSYLTIRISHGAKVHDPFFVSYRFRRPSDRPLDAGALKATLKWYAARAGIRKSKITFHMFRATHANDLQHIRGYNLPSILERMGWKDLSTAGRYLVRRERIHHTYNSLHEYWIEFKQIWNKDQEEINADTDKQSAESTGGDGRPDSLQEGGTTIERKA